MKEWDAYYPQELSINVFVGNLFGQRDFLSEVFTPQGGKNVLEVATGTSTMSIFGAWLGFTMTSIDINPTIIARAQALAEKLQLKINYQVADAFALPFPDNSFDTVFHQGLFEHFSDDDIRAMLDEQLRVARRVVFSVPNFLYPTRDLGNERLMRKEAWERILKGYKITRSVYYSPKIFPKFYIPRAKIQYMLVIAK